MDNYSDDESIGLIVNGLSDWYENILKAFRLHGKTWLQQTDGLKEEYLFKFLNEIKEKGYIKVFGYVQRPHMAIKYQFKVTGIKQTKEKNPPPDKTAPEFGSYDESQGKCVNGRLEYPVWLRVQVAVEISPIDPSAFLNIKNNKPLDHRYMRPPHFYVSVESMEDDSVLNQTIASDIEGLNEEEGFIEGTQKSRLSNYYERNPKLRIEAIRIHRTTCMGCGFNFEIKYGRHGKDFIEVHHLKPISTLGEATSINPREDMIVLCSNCHRMIHRDRKKVMQLDDLKKIIHV